MAKKKLYFLDEDSEWAYELEYHLEEAKELGLKEIELIEAVRETKTDYFGCREYDTVGTKEDSECGKFCEAYAPRNGKSGICQHWAYTYGHGKKVKFEVI